jgi:hypothetical protein
MQVTMLETVTESEQTYQTGTTYNVSDRLGLLWICNRKASLAKAEKVSDTREKAIPPTDQHETR